VILILKIYEYLCQKTTIMDRKTESINISQEAPFDTFFKLISLQNPKTEDLVSLYECKFTAFDDYFDLICDTVKHQTTFMFVYNKINRLPISRLFAKFDSDEFRSWVLANYPEESFKVASIKEQIIDYACHFHQVP